MAFEDKKTRLHDMLSGQAAEAQVIGKRTNVDPDGAANADHAADTDHAAGGDQATGGDQVAGAHEGEGVAHASAGAPGAPGAPTAPAASATGPAGPDASTAPPEGGHAMSPAIAKAKEGGAGAAAPAAGAPAAAPATPTPGKATGVGKIAVSSEKGAKGATASPAKFGVGEKATFTATEEGTWRLGETELGQGQSIEWTAPATGTIRNLVFEPYLTSPNKGQQASLPILVLAPSAVNFKKVGNIPVTGPGMAGVGMTLQVSIAPDGVSFGNAEWLEKPGPAEGVSGYFAAYVATGQSLAHPPNPNWLPMGDDNKAIVDNAWTRDKPKLKHPTDGTQRWWAGSFHWTIPNVYQVKGAPGEHKITSVVQRFTMDDQGAITVTKGGASATARPNNDMDGDIQKFANVAEATTFLTPHGRTGCIQQVMNYKRNPKADPASLQHLLAALRSFDVLLHVGVTCKNTFSWTDPDTVSVKANGTGATGGDQRINTGKSGEFVFNVNKILDLNNLGTDPINLLVDARDLLSSHPHTASLSYPYNVRGAALSGSDRYTYSAYFK